MTPDDPPLAALFAPFERGELAWPASERVIVLGARDGAPLRAAWCEGWLAQQEFKPYADALERAGTAVREPHDAECFDTVCVLPPRQREATRALLARALRLCVEGGQVVAATANNAGAASLTDDLSRLAGEPRRFARHKCRALCVTREKARIDAQLLVDWSALDALRPIASGGFVSRPGLFAWDRVDSGSALLADALPVDLHGHVGDLGAGYGYLGAQVLARCPNVTALAAFEAQASALEPLRINLERVNAARAQPAEITVHWHDVTAGLPQRFDAIVSNPPFHTGRADQPQLGQAFIAAAARALQPRGRLLLVANRHLPYEATLAAHFADLRVLAQRYGYKVFAARLPRI